MAGPTRELKVQKPDQRKSYFLEMTEAQKQPIEVKKGWWARFKEKRRQKAAAKAADKTRVKRSAEKTVQVKASPQAEKYINLDKLYYPQEWSQEQRNAKRQKAIEMIERGQKEAADLPGRIKRAVANKPFAEACRKANVDPGRVFRHYFTQSKNYAMHEFEAAMDAKKAGETFSRTDFCVKYIMENVLPKLKKQ